MVTYDFNPQDVNLDTADPAQIVCYLNAAGNEYNGDLGARISALFVILIVSTCVTFFPVLAKRVKWLRIPLYVYLFARYFGAGVIVATAFIHLLDPAYGEIGPQTCVGMTGNWASYSWPPAIVLVSVTVIFLMDLFVERFVEMKYGSQHDHNVESMITRTAHNHGPNSEEHTVSAMIDEDLAEDMIQQHTDDHKMLKTPEGSLDLEKAETLELLGFRQQIAAFLILEFGVIFHSVIIGLNLGTAGSEFTTLYPVLVFHQSFEGLGIGARMSAIPFPRGLKWLPYVLCSAYGLTTPIAIAIGLGLRHTYDGNSFTANIISGVLDSVSAGILIYTGLVELLARDFLFDPCRTRDNRRLTFMMCCVLLGAGIMALLGKWA